MTFFFLRRLALEAAAFGLSIELRRWPTPSGELFVSTFFWAVFSGSSRCCMRTVRLRGGFSMRMKSSLLSTSKFCESRAGSHQEKPQLLCFISMRSLNCSILFFHELNKLFESSKGLECDEEFDEESDEVDAGDEGALELALCAFMVNDLDVGAKSCCMDSFAAHGIERGIEMAESAYSLVVNLQYLLSCFLSVSLCVLKFEIKIECFKINESQSFLNNLLKI